MPTEDVLYMCELLGIEHSVDFEKLIKVGKRISHELSRPHPASVKLEDLPLVRERREELFK